MRGIPYSVDELELATAQPMDLYHRGLMRWAVSRIRALEQALALYEESPAMSPEHDDGQLARRAHG